MPVHLNILYPGMTSGAVWSRICLSHLICLDSVHHRVKTWRVASQPPAITHCRNNLSEQESMVHENPWNKDFNERRQRQLPLQRPALCDVLPSWASCSCDWNSMMAGSEHGSLWLFFSFPTSLLELCQVEYPVFFFSPWNPIQAQRDSR